MLILETPPAQNIFSHVLGIENISQNLKNELYVFAHF